MKSKPLSQLWKRNAVVAAIALFVCAAVYLNWNYEQQVGKTLGESTMVGAEDPLLQEEGGAAQTGEENAAQSGDLTEGDATLTGETGTGSDYFATARLNREQSRDSALSLLQQAAEGEEADETMVQEIQDSIQTMADFTVTEAQIENLVIAKGYADCVAFIGDNAVSLAVASPEGGITEADTARIVDVVHQTAGFTADQIMIIGVE